MLKNEFNTNNAFLSEFDKKAKLIQDRHRSQNVETINELNKKYSSKNIFEKSIDIWSAVEKLSLVSDPTDKELFAVSQWVHTLQVIEAMQQDNIKDEMLYVSGWIHDLGKLLLLTDEDPANIVCGNYVVSGEKGMGLNNCILNWNHDEFIYIKLKNMIPEDYLWLIRFHSISISQCLVYFNDYDKKLVNKFLVPFKKYDKKTKSIFNLPKLNLDYYKKMLEKHFGKINL